MSEHLQSHRECSEIFRSYILSTGGRWTSSRQEVLRAICSKEGHFTPDELLESARLQGTRLSAATVYRAIPLLEEAGILRRAPAASGATRSQACYEHVVPQEHHDHLLCTSCGKVVEFWDPAIELLQEAVAARHGFRLLSHRLELTGLCPACQEGR